MSRPSFRRWFTWCACAATLVACASDPDPFRLDGGDASANDLGAGDATTSEMDATTRDGASSDGATTDSAKPGDVVSPADATDAPRLPPTVDIVTPGTPADAPARFGGADDATRAPTIVYPAPDTIVPPNLTGVEVHFQPGAGNDLFEIAFAGATSTVRIYTGCTAVGGGCVLSLDAAAFDTVARAAQDSGRVQLTVRGTTAASGGRVGRSSAQPLGVTGTNVRGGIYYWASVGNIMRFEFGLAGARAEVYLRQPDPFNCLGCHVISRDGTRASVGRFIPAPARSNTYNVASRMTVGAEYGSNFSTFSPDSARLLVSDGARLTLLDAATGTAAAGLPAGITGSMPDWSPDGRSVVFARPRTLPPFGGQPGHGAPADLLLLPWSGTAFGAETTLLRAASGENNYYPAFSPDGAWVLFNRSAGESYNAIDARLWVVPASGGGMPARLAAADGMGDLGNSWPKWAPFMDSYQGEPLMWLTFSSRRDYGLRIQQQTRPADMRRAQLWMAAFRPMRAMSGDPSAAAFWLPFQSMAEGNHIAQWTQQVQRQSCTRNEDCAAGETCVVLVAGGRCVMR